MLGIQAEQKVFEDLKNLYPESSIITGAKLNGSNQYFDFIIADEKTNIPVMIIEVKAYLNNKNETEKRVFETLSREVLMIDYQVKAVAAIVSETSAIEYIDFTQAVGLHKFDLRVKNYTLPSYNLLVMGVTQKAINQEKSKQKKSLNSLKLFCRYIIPILCVALLFCDFKGWFIITIPRLIVFGGLCLSLLLPSFKEIRIGEIDLKQIIESSDKS